MGLMGTFCRTVFFAVPISATFFDLVGTVVAVEGVSMQPALNPATNGHHRPTTDYVFLNRWAANCLQFERGEVVSLVSPSNPGQRYIKRIVALEGDTVRTLSYKETQVMVPPGHCWVEGDHHGRSVDSNIFGPVALGLITGKASYIVWPPSRWGRLSTHLPDSHRVHKRSAAFTQ